MYLLFWRTIFCYMVKDIWVVPIHPQITASIHPESLHYQICILPAHYTEGPQKGLNSSHGHNRGRQGPSEAAPIQILLPLEQSLDRSCTRIWGLTMARWSPTLFGWSPFSQGDSAESLQLPILHGWEHASIRCAGRTWRAGRAPGWGVFTGFRTWGDSGVRDPGLANQSDLTLQVQSLPWSHFQSCLASRPLRLMSASPQSQQPDSTLHLMVVCSQVQSGSKCEAEGVEGTTPPHPHWWLLYGTRTLPPGQPVGPSVNWALPGPESRSHPCSSRSARRIPPACCLPEGPLIHVGAFLVPEPWIANSYYICFCHFRKILVEREVKPLLSLLLVHSARSAPAISFQDCIRLNHVKLHFMTVKNLQILAISCGFL